MMPIVSVNLSPRAYLIYDYLSKSRKASSILSTQLVNWDSQHTTAAPTTGPMLMPGDMRRMWSGDVCEWTDDGWRVVGGEEE